MPDVGSLLNPRHPDFRKIVIGQPAVQAVLDKSVALGQCHRMKQRPKAKSKPRKARDPYLPALGKIWPTILEAYNDFKDIEPIVVYELREQRLWVYQAQDYINDLTERTREQTRRIHADAVAAGNFMVFVCDTKERVLRSYVFPAEAPEGGCFYRTAS